MLSINWLQVTLYSHINAFTKPHGLHRITLHKTKSTISASTISSGGQWREDVRTKKGADIASDHHLLVAKMKLKLKKHWTMGRTTAQKIQERRNKKAAINTSRTRTEKTKAQAEYTELNKQMKRSIRTDKRKYVEDIAMTTEKAVKEGNMRQLYDTTKKLSGNYRKPERPVEIKESKVITNIEEQRNRWVEHFKELLNRPAPLKSPNIEAASTELPINVGPPIIEETSMAIRQI
ncbi:unnamed protein product [Schistosoma mattheei]|uniref:Uncharacterized protein n=1 Tax=Schistosoma mattheei TaxID=31246 RepID=A0A183P4C4_9TREM|nr:unnamed protein product [Schistosoma mattheei]